MLRVAGRGVQFRWSRAFWIQKNKQRDSNHPFCTPLQFLNMKCRNLIVSDKTASYEFALPTHRCGELTKEMEGQRVTLGGWLDAKRVFASTGTTVTQKGALIFLGILERKKER